MKQKWIKKDERRKKEMKKYVILKQRQIQKK